MSVKGLSRKQLRELRNQVRLNREIEIQELEKQDQEAAVKKREQYQTKKDSRGFTRQQRPEIREKIRSLEKTGPKVTWNFDVGNLVYLPTGAVGIVVEQI